MSADITRCGPWPTSFRSGADAARMIVNQDVAVGLELKGPDHDPIERHRELEISLQATVSMAAVAGRCRHTKREPFVCLVAQALDIFLHRRSAAHVPRP